MSDSLLHQMLKKATVSASAAPVAPSPQRRASIHGGRYARWHTDVEPVAEEEAWMITYLDVITLLLVMMVVMLAFAGPTKAKLRGDEDPQAQKSQVAAGNAQPDPSIVPPLPLPVPGQTKGTGQGAQGNDPGQGSDKGQGAGAQPDALAGLPLDALGSSISIEKKPGSVSFRISSELLFSSAEANLTPAGQEVVDRLLPVLNKLPDYSIVVEGHTDNIPIQTARYPSNWELAAGRAGSVVRHLQSRGLNPTRLRASGYADTHPLSPNTTPQGRADNRRVEITLEAPPTRP
ncbi:MAG TPA: OmpA family protein [Macromonas sp.]|nr:OmpA family protein [Macromonas sp.]